MSDDVQTSVDIPAASPGAILRRCREYHDITIKEAAEATKVGEAYLEALEGDRTGEFANLAYLKGFLRIYAAYLGLNPEDMSRMYERLYNPGADTGNSPADNTPLAAQQPRRRIPLKRLLLPLLLVLAILATSSLIRRTDQAPVSRPSPPVTTGGSSQEQQGVQPARSSVRAAKSVPREESPLRQELHDQRREQKTAAAPVAEPRNGLFVRMKIVGGGTLNATIDGSGAQRYELSAGDLFEWKADRKVLLEVSDGASVEAELNGKTLGALGQSGRPALVTIDAEGIHR